MAVFHKLDDIMDYGRTIRLIIENEAVFRFLLQEMPIRFNEAHMHKIITFMMCESIHCEQFSKTYELTLLFFSHIVHL